MTRKTRLCLAVTFALAGGAAQAQDWRAKTDASVLARVDRGEEVDVLIELRTVAQLQMLAPARHVQRVAAAAAQLQAVAESSQAPLRAELAARGIVHRPFWIANAIAARVPAHQLAALAARDDVAHIESDAPRPGVILPPQEPEARAPDAPDAVEWGIARVNAPQVWAAGVTGAGVVIAGQDTGYAWQHPALQPRYRGWNGTSADHNYNWHDAIHELIAGGANSCGLNLTAPCDDGSHGTHTMGTMVGSDGANEVGVAPGAKWIGCRNMEEGDGRPSTYIECFQWFALPTDIAGANPDPTKAPHVINNSWGCPIGPPPGGEDCVVDSIQQAVDNVRNGAGIIVVVSAGNSGSGCSTVSAPPSYYASAFTVGSTTSAVPDAISGFSSRGPATADGSNRLKPDISAPGSSIRSTVPPAGYGSLSGTSMAGPHVAGVAALVMSANPALIGDPDAVETIIKTSARPFTSTQNCGSFLGANIPNAVFGHGIIDAFAAYQMALSSADPPIMRDGFEEP